MKAFVASVIALCLQIPVVSQAPAPVQTRSTPGTGDTDDTEDSYRIIRGSS